MNYRIEIISNQSVQEDIVELLESKIPGIEYTIIPVVQGRGKSSKKLGNSTWPEQNFLLFSYLTQEDARAAKNVFEQIKAKFPHEGITFFCVEEAELL